MGLRDNYLFKDKRCFFITTSCNNHLRLFLNENSYKIVADSLTFLNNKYSAQLLAYVLMPNHIHLILYFTGENRLSDYMRDFKKYTSVRLRKEIEQAGYNNLLEKLTWENRSQKFKVWQDRFDSVFLEDRLLLEVKLAYIHNNPLQEHWQLCKYHEDYKYSSAGFYLAHKESFIPITHYRDYF